MRYNIDQVKSQKGWIMSNLTIISKIGAVIGIGKPNQRTYLYSLIKKYKNIINTEEKAEIKIPGEALKIIDIKEVTDRDAPIVIIEWGIIMFTGIFILYRLNMKNENPKTVNARENANTIKPGNILNVLKVSQAKLNIKIHERLKSIILFFNFTYFEEKRLKPTIMKLIFKEKIVSNIIE